MPSVINANTSPSEIDFVSDKPIFYSEQLSSSSSSLSKDSSKPTIQDLKESNRRRQQWNDPDDEFSVPIHTEFPLISKSPLDMASFLLNHRTMHRSIEIMTPPVEVRIVSMPQGSPIVCIPP
ncbi:hypothetical protein BGX27_003307 [Mortierella sp. AM989]|nr:hypothetical protein BGX27_003307 [Mortierella sp. AM989]